MGLFGKKKKNSDSDNSKVSKNKNEALYRKKKRNSRKKSRTQFPLISSMKLKKISPSSLLDFLANSKEGMLNSFDVLLNNIEQHEGEKGFLVIALSEEDFKKSKLTRSDNPRDFGEFTNSISKDLIRSASLPTNIEQGYVVLVPSKSALENIGEFDELRQYKDGFFWAVLPENISDSAVDTAKAYILESRVTYDELSKLSESVSENAELKLTNIKYNDQHDMIDADISVTDGGITEVISKQEVSSSSEGEEEEEEVAEELDVPEAQEPTELVKATKNAILNIQDDQGDVPVLGLDSDSELVTEDETDSNAENQSGLVVDSDNTLSENDKIDALLDNEEVDVLPFGNDENNTVIDNSDLADNYITSEAQDVNNLSTHVESAASEETVVEDDDEEDILSDDLLFKGLNNQNSALGNTNVDTTDATSYTSRLKKIAADLGKEEKLEVDVSELDALLSKKTFSIPFKDEVVGNNLNELLNVKISDANQRLAKMHDDNIKSIISLYKNSMQQGFNMIKEATDLTKSQNEFGRKKAEIEQEYRDKKDDNDKLFAAYKEAEEANYDKAFEIYLDKITASAKESYETMHRQGLEEKLSSKRAELDDTLEVNKQKDLDELSKERKDRIARLYDEINEATINRISEEYNSKFYNVEKELSAEFSREIEEISEQYLKDEIARQKTVQDKLDNDKTVEDLKLKLAETEESKQALIINNNNALNRSETEARERIKSIQDQYDSEILKRNEEFMKTLEEKDKELKKQQAKINELENESSKSMRANENRYDELRRNFDDEKRKLVDEYDSKVRELKTQQALEMQAKEQAMTERMKQKDMETTRAVRNTKAFTTVGMIATFLFGISIPFITEHFMGNTDKSEPVRTEVVSQSSHSEASSSHSAKESDRQSDKSEKSTKDNGSSSESGVSQEDNSNQESASNATTSQSNSNYSNNSQTR
ncbi:hypothetical protein [Ligilactobacillus equi]|nr:hypothetical protein [Ligilactobacillus equi]